MPWLLLLACAPGTEADPGLALSGNSPTVVEVSYPADAFAEGEAFVEFGVDGAFDRRAEFEAHGDGWRALLLGHKPLTEVELRVVRVAEDGELSPGETRSITTGPTPSWLSPTLMDPAGGGLPLDGRLLLTTNVASPAAVLVIDGDGDFVWWTEYDLFGMIARARLSLDGSSFLAMPVNVDGMQDGKLLRLGLDGSLVETIGFPGAHHDFVELADGTIAALTHDVREIDGVEVRGDALVERSPDGSFRELWSAFDSFDPTEDDGAEEREDWTHANSLAYVAESDSWLVTLLGMRAVLNIDRQGEVVWALGGPGSTFQTPQGDPVELGRVHQATFSSTGSLLVFENGASDSDEGSSRGLELDLDAESEVAATSWSYQPDPPLSTFALGDVVELKEGGRLVVFSSNGRIDQVSADGQLQWRLSTSLGQTFGYADLLDFP